MSISDSQRYYLKLKALYYFYKKGYSNSDIAKMLGISRVTLNRLMAEAREEGMVKIEIIDPRNLSESLELEDRLKTRYNLDYVKIVKKEDDDPSKIIDSLALEGAKYLERIIRSGMKLGLGWGRTLTALISNLSHDATVSDLEVYTLMGGACSEANFQPNLLAQALINYYEGNTYIINAPFICHSELLCREIKKEPHISRIMNVASELDLAIVGIGQFPTKERLQQSYFDFSDDVVEELNKAGAVGDMCGIFLDEEGRICRTSVSDRIVAVNIDELKSCKQVMAVAGGEGKALSVRAALKGGYINILITDNDTAAQILAEDE